MLKRFYLLLIIPVSFLLIVSCVRGDDNFNDDIVSDSLVEVLDSTDFLDNIYSKDEEDFTSTTLINDADLLDSKKEIEKKYGQQWDFCTCITKQDSIDKAFKNTDDDEQFDLIIARSDFIDTKCKEILVQPNSTPEEREIHQKRIKDCLKSAK